MRFLLRQCMGLLLVLVIGFASVQLAVARGQSPAVSTMVICTGTGLIHILVDENGEPTGSVMVCPDYALAFYADATIASPDLVRLDVWQLLWLSRTEALSAEQAAPLSQARGPPLSV